MNKKEKNEHIQNLFNAMRNKKGVIHEEDEYKNKYLIQRIDLDGNCDLYSTVIKEIIYYEATPEQLTITKTTLKR